MLYSYLAGSQPHVPRRAAYPFIVGRQGGHGFALDSILVMEDKKERGFFYILKMGLSQEGPIFLPSPLFFKSPVGGKIGDMHGGNLWPLVLCPVFGFMFLS